MPRSVKAPLQLLRVFESAGRHLSFKKAANELNVTPPAISHQVKQLEEILGQTLFERKSRELCFTNIGKNYWLTVNQAICKLDKVTKALADQPSTSSLAVSVLPPLLHSVVIPNLKSFKEEYPHIELKLDANIRNISIESGQADLAIRFGTGDWPLLKSTKLLDLYVQPLLPRSLKKHYDLSHFESLLKIPLVHMTTRPAAWDQYFGYFKKENSTAREHYYLDDYPAAIDGAKHLGAALGLMPIEQRLIDNDDVIAPYPKAGPLNESIYAVYSYEKAEVSNINAFISWLKKILTKLDS